MINKKQCQIGNGIGSFVVQLLIGGLESSYYVLFKDIQQAFESNSSVIAVAIGLTMFIRLILGPIIVGLAIRFSCRAITGTGSLILAASLIGASFSRIGASCAFMPCLHILTENFKTLQSTAFSIASIGQPVGSFIFTYLTAHLLREYGMKNTLFLLGGILFNILPFGLMFWNYRLMSENNEIEELNVKENRHSSSIISNQQLSRYEYWDQSIQDLRNDRNLSADDIPMIEFPNRHRISISSQPNILSDNISSSSFNDDNFLDFSNVQSVSVRTSSIIHYKYSQRQTDSRRLSSSMHNISVKREIWYDAAGNTVEVEREIKTPVVTENTQNNTANTKQSSDKTKSLCARIKKFLNWEPIINNPRVLWYAIALVPMMMGISVWSLFIVDYAKNYNVSETLAVSIIPIDSMCQLVPRLFCGFIFDLPSLKKYRRIVYLLAMISATVCAYLFNIIPTVSSSQSGNSVFICFLIIAIVRGFSVGIVFSQTNVLPSDFCDSSILGSIIGFICFTKAIGILAGTYIAGSILDATDYYPNVYSYIGGVNSISCLILGYVFLF